ncbi:MAG: gliding motility-associated C-terminal domain-containing protein, partial [Bacteroidota bacterium]
ISGNNTGTSWSADDPNATNGSYDTPIIFGPYPISGGDLNITITDGSDAGCTTTFSVTAPTTCSVPVCDVSANVGQPTCNDNGTPNDPTDDTFSFSATISGNNTGTSWSADDPNATNGSYDTPIIFGPYPISGGDLNIIIVDGGDASCTIGFSVSAPAACSFCNPSIELGPDGTISCTEPNWELFGSAPGAVAVSWTNPDGQVIATSSTTLVQQAGSYLFTAIFPDGCTATATTSVFADQDAPLVLILANPDSVLNCVASSISLSTIPESDVVYSWETAEGSVQATQLQVNQAGTYNLVAIDTINGCSNSASIAIEDLTEYPFIDLAREATLDCNSGSFTIDASGSQQGSTIDYQWLDDALQPISGATQNQLSISQSGTYYLQLTDRDNGCQNLDTILINPAVPLQINLVTEVEANQNEPFLLTASTSIPAEELDLIQWNPADLVSCDSCLQTRALNTEDQRFTLFVADQNGCSASADILVRRIPLPAVYIPTAFSPNGDGVNDLFLPLANEEVAAIDYLIIANRWGEIVFQVEDFPLNDLTAGWDGNFRGQSAPPAVYVYFLKVRLQDGSVQELKGGLTLVR